jgi:NADH-quinone oxidoreductase subunit N
MIDVPSFADLNLGVAAPAIFLSLYTTVLLLVDVLAIPKDRKIHTAHLALVGLLVAFVLNLRSFNSDETALGGMFIADEFTGFVNIIVLGTAFITVLLSVDYLKRTKCEQGEFYSLLLFSTTGMMLMASGNSLIVLFIALELLSIPLYVMAAIRYTDPKSEESGMKYFILGAFASAFFLYGAAMVYGSTGSAHLPDIFAAVGDMTRDSAEMYFLLIGAAMILVGLGFKVAAVPFHMWTPDVYEGAPTPVTAFMSVGAKAGGFAALLRVMTLALPALHMDAGDTIATWQTAVVIISALTMILGNFVAVSQSNIKRMLAYSSIAHAGYILMAVAAAGTAGLATTATKAALIYLMAYMFTNLGAFAVVLSVEKDDGTGTDLDDFVGLGTSKPLLAFMMAVFMFSLTGIPLTSGFTGKWLVFSAAIDANLIVLAVIGVLTSVVSAYYYVRVVVNMYLREGDGDAATGATQYVTWATMAAFAGTLLLGVFPGMALDLLDTMSVAFHLLPF